MQDDEAKHVSNGMATTDEDSVFVPARTLTNILHSAQIDRVSLLKLNIEGMELPILKAFGTGLDRVNHVVIGCHDFKADRTGNEWQRTFTPVQSILVDAGFKVMSRAGDPRPWVRCYLYGMR